MSKIFYWKLDYKEKFYRTLSIISFLILISIIFALAGINTYVNILITSMNFILCIFQLIYNYKKLKLQKNISKI
ncbi:hypothetical protein NX821_002319 [Clostridium septicum]|uniref:hypothetical protein n=1 Tax=Clostridium septicum TaxID=1504 RepID=UPI003217AFBE